MSQRGGRSGLRSQERAQLHAFFCGPDRRASAVRVHAQLTGSNALRSGTARRLNGGRGASRRHGFYRRSGPPNPFPLAHRNRLIHSSQRSKWLSTRQSGRRVDLSKVSASSECADRAGVATVHPLPRAHKSTLAQGRHLVPRELDGDAALAQLRLPAARARAGVCHSRIVGHGPISEPAP